MAGSLLLSCYMNPTPDYRDGGAMTDGELMNIAAFKLRESANRILALAQEARSDEVRGRLFAVCEQLMRQEKRFYALEPGE